MTTRALCIVLLAAAAVRGQLTAKSWTVHLGGDDQALAHVLADADGDGQADLVAAWVNKKDRKQILGMWMAPADGGSFRRAPDRQLELTPDVVAFAAGDVHADPGDEVVLFTSASVFAWRTAAKGRDRLVKLVAAPLLWQTIQSGELFALGGAVRDVDGDPLADLVIPGPEGFTIAYQRRDASGVASFAMIDVPKLPADAQPEVSSHGGGAVQVRGGKNSLRVNVDVSAALGAAPSTDEPLVDISTRVPVPVFSDADGDGRLDLICQGGEGLHVWHQRAGRFARDPDEVRPLPVVFNRARQLDISYSAHIADIDGDARADYLVIAGDQGSKDIRTQVLAYRSKAGPLFGTDGTPQQLLVIAGFVGLPQLIDVDGDGKPDLVVSVVRPDLIDGLRGGSERSIEADLLVYRNEGGAFAAKPTASLRLTVPSARLRGGSAQVSATFIGDVTGNGLSALCVRTDDARADIFMLRRTQQGFTFLEKPIGSVPIPPESDLTPLTVAGSNILAVSTGDSHSITLTRFGP